MQLEVLREHRRSASIRLYGLESPTLATDLQRTGGAGLDSLQEIVQLTRAVLGVDGAGVNLLVDDEQVTLATTGPAAPPVTRSRSICSTVLREHEGEDLIEIADMTAVPDLADNPFVDGSCAALRFYAAAPLTGKHGLALGTLCAWSEQPRQLDELQRGTLRQFGRAVLNVLDERRRALVPLPGGVLAPRDLSAG